MKFTRRTLVWGWSQNLQETGRTGLENVQEPKLSEDQEIGSTTVFLQEPYSQDTTAPGAA